MVQILCLKATYIHYYTVSMGQEYKCAIAGFCAVSLMSWNEVLVGFTSQVLT